MVYTADELRCHELLDTKPHETHPWRDHYKRVLRNLVLGSSSLAVLQGLFGSGKTLFIRWTIAEHSYYFTSMIPIYLKMRDLPNLLLRRKHLNNFEVKDVKNVASLILLALKYTIHRCANDVECASSTLIKEAKKLIEEIERFEQASEVDTIELLENLASKSKYIVALLIDELEYVAWLAGSSVGDALMRRYAVATYQLLRDVFDDLYRLLHRGRDYVIVIATSLSFKDLLITTLDRNLDLRSRSLVPPMLVDAISSFVETIAKYYGFQGLVERITSSRDIDEARKQLDKLRNALQRSIEPGVYTRLRPNLVELNYYSQDYLKILKANAVGIDLESPRNRVIIEYFAKLAEKAKIPPRTYMFIVDRYISNDSTWRETLNAMNALKAIAYTNKKLRNEILKALEPIESALRSTETRERIKALCIDFDKIANLSDDVLRRVYESIVYLDEEGKACYIPRLEILSALFEGLSNNVPNPRNPLENINEAITKLLAL